MRHTSFLFITTLLAGVMLTACQSRLKVKKIDGPSSGTQTPDIPVIKPGDARQVREIPYSGSDRVVQTTSLLKLPIPGDLLTDVTSLHLKNLSEPADTEINLSILADCSGVSCFGFAARMANQQAPEQKFLKYGENSLQLLAVSPSEDRMSPVKITMKDFRVFGPVLMRAVSDDGSISSAPAPIGKLQSISLMVVPVPPSAADAPANPLDPILISNWQEAVQRP